MRTGKFFEAAAMYIIEFDENDIIATSGLESVDPYESISSETEEDPSEFETQNGFMGEILPVNGNG